MCFILVSVIIESILTNFYNTGSVSPIKIYLSSNNGKPLFGDLDKWAGIDTGILVKLKIKGCNQYTTTKNKISENTG